MEKYLEILLPKSLSSSTSHSIVFIKVLVSSFSPGPSCYHHPHYKSLMDFAQKYLAIDSKDTDKILFL